MRSFFFFFPFVVLLLPATSASVITQRQPTAGLESCPGYTASNIAPTTNGLTADLKLAGPACNTYGQDLDNLKLSVVYETATRLHVKIYDADQDVYQVPESVLPRPNVTTPSSAESAAIKFNYIASPFSFSVTRASSNETLFDTSAASLVFQSQYVRLRTKLPDAPHLYGLGEHTDPFQLNTTNYTRTLWSRDAYGTPPGTNLYGNHPVYYDHRGASGTHGVFLLNSNGMDIKINKTVTNGQYLEYNTLGGIIDLYFLAGPTPKDAARQFGATVGLPVMQPYWGLGFHQCRYGYVDVYEVAEVVANYSSAGIGLETMWTDIDYMDSRKVFTLDPLRFPLKMMRELVSTLHERQQHYVVMVDPAVAYLNNSAYDNGLSSDAFLKYPNGSIYEGVVWPGVTVFPDWFHPRTQSYWNKEFMTFFDASTGVDIDALWIDMNEASNFCPYPCANPQAFAVRNNNPPAPAPLRNNSRPTIPGFPAGLQPSPASSKRSIQTRQLAGKMLGLPGRDLINPKYLIKNAAGSISNFTISSELIHYNGLTEYDTHNLYGTMMSEASYNAMRSRRPTRRPLIITRSTFAGAGRKVGHWLGDNFSDEDHYRFSISGLLQFASLYQVPMVGSDVCGFAGNTNPTLCARWAMLGAFSSFYRNHNADGQIPQEFYRWPVVTKAAKVAIDIRYRLLDYLYTALWQQTTDGTPLINPMFFQYPNDINTAPIEYQYFYGDALLVSPVTDVNSTSVNIYLPNDIFYDFYTGAPIRGEAKSLQLTNINYTTIPLHIRGGTVLPLRMASANTTTELRKQNFHIMIAPGLDGKASGQLYLDEGNAIDQPKTSLVKFEYANGNLKWDGNFGYDPGVKVEKLTLLGGNSNSSKTSLEKRWVGAARDVGWSLLQAGSVDF
ncbi:Glycoside hydrolase family 31 [Venturia nashicola]|nr:Glycoside hydrolase family 31 [Venturia nashicola]